MAEQLVKKEWTEPELIVLVRSNPEEAIMAGCKYPGKSGETTWNSACMFGYESGCEDCTESAVS